MTTPENDLEAQLELVVKKHALGIWTSLANNMKFAIKEAKKGNPLYKIDEGMKAVIKFHSFGRIELSWSLYEVLGEAVLNYDPTALYDCIDPKNWTIGQKTKIILVLCKGVFSEPYWIKKVELNGNLDEIIAYQNPEKIKVEYTLIEEITNSIPLDWERVLQGVYLYQRIFGVDVSHPAIPFDKKMSQNLLQLILYKELQWEDQNGTSG